MKKTTLVILLLILGIGFSGNLLAQASIVVGDGTESNTGMSDPTPYGTFFKAFRQHYLVRASELIAEGGGPGEITAIAFKVSSLNQSTPMSNFRIRIKTTTNAVISRYFETGTYQEVFQQNTYSPTVGWNTHEFSTPFDWDGSSNLLIEVVTDLCSGDSVQNASVFYTVAPFNCSLRYNNDYQNGMAGTQGLPSPKRSNMRFTMAQGDVQDMAAVSITGPNAPSLNMPSNYTVRVKNLCPEAVSDYSVKLMMVPEIELASLPGVSIDPMAEQDFVLPWTPHEEGTFQLFGRVVMTGDETLDNNDTPLFPVTIIPEGLISVVVGEGTDTNNSTEAPTPYGTRFKNFREQYLIRASELNNAGGGSGAIHGISFNVAALNNVLPMPNYRIRLKHTSQTSLSTTFETGTYTQVFQADEYMPTAGWNFHPFSTPFVWNGTSNVLVDILTDFCDVYSGNAAVYHTNVGFTSCLRFHSDYDSAGQATVGIFSSTNRCNMMFNMQSFEMQDMVALSVVGPTAPEVNTLSEYTIRVKNISTSAISDYTVNLMEYPDILIGSVAGIEIASMEELEFVIPWTPTEIGPTHIFGNVDYSEDENLSNNNTPMLNVDVMEAGILYVLIGDGTQVNTNITNPAPYGTSRRAFREQYLIKASEIYDGGGAMGLINYIAFNVQNIDQCTAMSNYRIRLKHTQLVSLTITFEDGDYQEVFQADTFMPVNGWNIHNFDYPFSWNGVDNLIVDIVTDVTPGEYARNAIVYNHDAGFNSTLRFQSNEENGDMGADGTLSTNRANMRLRMALEDMGSLSGVVYSENEAVEGALVVVEETIYSTITAADGSYNIPFIPVGSHTLSVSKHGCYDGSEVVNIVLDQETIQDISLAPIPKVTVSGRIVGGGIPMGGLDHAQFSLNGYEYYITETDYDGYFSIPGVYIENSYTYKASSLTHAMSSGTLDVGTTNINMGEIILEEIAYPPHNIVASESANFQNVFITWDEPNMEGSWLSYITQESTHGIGVDGISDFDVAIRFSPSDLADYAGMSLHAITMKPCVAGEYSLRVWTGGTATAPGTMVVDMPINPNIDVFNTIALDEPVYISGDEELWFGYRSIVASSASPAGCDIGPAVNGFGNMIHFQGNWASVYDLAPNLNYNWLIEGYVGFTVPTRSDRIAMDAKMNKHVQNDSRDLFGYRVWRLQQGQEYDESQWTVLTEYSISATGFQDSGWHSLPEDVYRWAVKAEYGNDVLSVPRFSNALVKGANIGTLAGVVRNLNGQIIKNATICSGESSVNSSVQGLYSMTLPTGTHTISVSHPLYAGRTYSGIVINTGQNTSLDIILEDINVLLSEDFENYPNFAASFAPWTLHDLDGSDTYSFSAIEFPGSGDPMSFTIFNPSATIPPIEQEAHSGAKFAACFAAVDAPNNDWMITPQVPGGGKLKFWARSYMDSSLERLKIGVSTSGTDAANFSFIQSGNYLQVPLEWTEYVIDLGAYLDQDIYVGFNCVSDDCFILCIDDVEISAFVSADDPTAPAVVTELKSNYPNPFNPETTISFSVKDAGYTSIKIFNVKGQLVRELFKGELASGMHSVVWNGKDNHGKDVSSGVYYYQMNSGNYSSTKKMILMK